MTAKPTAANISNVFFHGPRESPTQVQQALVILAPGLELGSPPSQSWEPSATVRLPLPQAPERRLRWKLTHTRGCQQDSAPRGLRG